VKRDQRNMNIDGMQINRVRKICETNTFQKDIDVIIWLWDELQFRLDNTWGPL